MVSPVVILLGILMLFLLAISLLFVHISKPGQRTVPGLVILASVTGGVLLFRVAPPLGLLVLIGGTVAGFVLAATAPNPPSSGNPPSTLH